LRFLGDKKGKILNIKAETPQEINPHRNTSSNAKKVRRYSQKCVLQSLAKMCFKKEKKKEKITHF